MKKQSFQQFLIEAGGAQAGKLELVKTSLEDARSYAEKKFDSVGLDLDKEIPNFDKNYEKAKSIAGLGKTKRKDMPVISNKDVKDFQNKLRNGELDVKNPYSKATQNSEKYPKGLDGNSGKEWLKRGTKDGAKEDDKIPVEVTKRVVGLLKPIQQQIYFDKGIDKMAGKDGNIKNTIKYLTSKNNHFIISKDNFIIDGHHRFLSAMLIDPKMEVNVSQVDLDIKELLPLSLSYSDQIGNKRNG